MRIEDQSNDIITLNHTLDPLKERFNAESSKIRFMALLSPTCPLWRDQGARAVHENVFSRYPHADVSGSIVWIPILENDTFDAAVPSVKALSDARINHFYDSDRFVGKTVAASVGWHGKVAWDIYLFYGPAAKWTAAPPKPKFWMHQLRDDWAKKDQYRTGDDLKNGLLVSMEKCIDNLA